MTDHIKEPTQAEAKKANDERHKWLIENDYARPPIYTPLTYTSLEQPQIHRPCGLLVGHVKTHLYYCPAGGQVELGTLD